MAKTTFTRLTDDLDNSVIEDGKGDTVTFAYKGTSYEIDLSDKNIKKFDDAMSQFVSAARRASVTSGGRGGARSKSADRDRGYDIADLRRWAADNNIEIPARGRIKAETVQQYLDQR